MLDFSTRNWLQHHVTTDLRTYDDLEPFLKRPFFFIISVDGPLRTRHQREHEWVSLSFTSAIVGDEGKTADERQRRTGATLDAFIDIHDKLNYGHGGMTDFARVMTLATIRVDNSFPTIDALWHHLDSLNLMDEERLRPGWDTYFMVRLPFCSSADISE